MTSAELKKLIVRVTGIDHQSPDEDFSLGHEKWDSMAHIAIFTELEAQTGRSFSAEQIIKTKSLQDLSKLVKDD